MTPAHPWRPFVVGILGKEIRDITPKRKDFKENGERTLSKGRETVDTRRLFSQLSKTDAREMHTKTEREASASCY